MPVDLSVVKKNPSNKIQIKKIHCDSSIHLGAERTTISHKPMS